MDVLLSPSGPTRKPSSKLSKTQEPEFRFVQHGEATSVRICSTGAGRLGFGKAKASEATTMPGVDIEWDHGDAEKSERGAKEMIDGFGLAVPPSSTNAPALLTNHTPGKALDMEITWNGTIKIKRKDGAEEPVYSWRTSTRTRNCIPLASPTGSRS
jgi:hypothetical protein